MNTIAEKQVEVKSLDFLAAQRQLYSEAKKLFLINTIISVPLIVILSILIFKYSTLNIALIICGLIVFLANFFILNPTQKKKQKNAAIIQQMFDYYVLDMSHERLNTERLSDRDLIFRKSDKYKDKNSGHTGLIDWYPTIASQVPIHYGRLICQHENISWEGKLRSRYIQLIYLVGVILFLSLITYGILKSLLLKDFIVLIFAPLLPVLYFAIQQIVDNNRAIYNLKNLKSKFEDYWQEIISSETISDERINDFSYKLQEQIYSNRYSNPLIFNWMYDYLQSKDETSMKKSAEQLVNELKAANKI